MKPLYEMPNTVVHLQTESECKEYLKMCDQVGWRWKSGYTPLSNVAFDYFEYGSRTCIEIANRLTFSVFNYFKINHKIITFDELKELLKEDNL